MEIPKNRRRDLLCSLVCWLALFLLLTISGVILSKLQITLTSHLANIVCSLIPVLLFQLLNITYEHRPWTVILKALIHYFVSTALSVGYMVHLFPATIDSVSTAVDFSVNYTLCYAAVAIFTVLYLIRIEAQQESKDAAASDETTLE